MIVLERAPVGSRENSSASDAIIVVDADLEEDESTKEEKLSVEASGGMSDGV